MSFISKLATDLKYSIYILIIYCEYTSCSCRILLLCSVLCICFSKHVLAVVFMATEGKIMLFIANIHSLIDFHSASSYVDKFACFK